MGETASDGIVPTIMEARTEPTNVPSVRGVNHLGYRKWADRLAPGWSRWSVITQVGVRRAWQNRWLRRALGFACFPALWFGFGFFVWEQAIRNPLWRNSLNVFLAGIPNSALLGDLQSAVQGDSLEANRHSVWAWILQTYFRYPQGVLMVMVVGMIAPPLISQDIRSRAFLIFFSRPLTRTEYLMGKLATLWTFQAAISTLPALCLYVLGVMLSPEISVIYSTWDLPFRIIGASAALLLPTSILALCFSSLTQESRYAAFGWYAIWILGWFTYFAGATAETNRVIQSNYDRHQRMQRHLQMHGVLPQEDLDLQFKESEWTHISLYHTLGRVQSWIFGFAKFGDVFWSLVILTVVTLIAFAILFRRISAPMRI